MTRKQELQKKLSKLNKEYKEKEKSMEENPEYINIKKEERRWGMKSDKLLERRDEIEREIKLIFLDNNRNPKYKSSSDSWGQKRNIRPEVLSSIKRAFGITNLSHLKASDIQNITQKLIDLEMKKNEELQKNEEEDEKTKEEHEEVERKEEEFEKRLQDLYDKKWEVERELFKIEEAKKKTKDMKNPEKLKKIERYKKEEEAQKKIKNINLERLRLEITKERIVNSLEDEDDE